MGDGGREAYLEVLRNFTNKPLEGQLADEELGRLLVPTDLAESDGTRPEAVRLLHTTSSGLKDTSIYWRTMTSRGLLLLLLSCALTWQRAAYEGPCLMLNVSWSASVMKCPKALTTGGLASGLLGTSH